MFGPLHGMLPARSMGAAQGTYGEDDATDEDDTTQMPPKPAPFDFHRYNGTQPLPASERASTAVESVDFALYNGFKKRPKR